MGACPIAHALQVRGYAFPKSPRPPPPPRSLAPSLPRSLAPSLSRSLARPPPPSLPPFLAPSLARFLAPSLPRSPLPRSLSPALPALFLRLRSFHNENRRRPAGSWVGTSRRSKPTSAAASLPLTTTASRPGPPLFVDRPGPFSESRCRPGPTGAAVPLPPLRGLPAFYDL